MSTTLTVFFDSPFYAAIVERTCSGELRAAKTVFGAEPSEPEILDWVQKSYASLRFSPPVAHQRPVRLAENPKRRQRQAARAVNTEIGTYAQQAIKLQHEAQATARTDRRREQREAEEAQRFQLRQEKKKARHRGH